MSISREAQVTFTTLSDKHRLAILFKVGEKPGLTFNELANDLGMDKKDLTYGLGVLYSQGFVAYRHVDGQVATTYMLSDAGEHWYERLTVDAAILGPFLREQR
jgi:DNA-binding transcriptional ArsR family regulator